MRRAGTVLLVAVGVAAASGASTATAPPETPVVSCPQHAEGAMRHEAHHAAHAMGAAMHSDGMHQRQMPMPRMHGGMSSYSPGG
jgi:hypothetical protein